MGWTDERVELLRKLWQDGLSASQIARQLGRVTRNAARSSSVITVRSNSISSTPGAASATRCTSSASSSEPGHAATGRASSIRTRRRRDFTSRSIPMTPRGSPNSGSTMASSAPASSV